MLLPIVQSLLRTKSLRSWSRLSSKWRHLDCLSADCIDKASGVHTDTVVLEKEQAYLSEVSGLFCVRPASDSKFTRLAALSIDGYDVADTRNQS